MPRATNWPLCAHDSPHFKTESPTTQPPSQSPGHLGQTATLLCLHFYSRLLPGSSDLLNSQQPHLACFLLLVQTHSHQGPSHLLRPLSPSTHGCLEPDTSIPELSSVALFVNLARDTFTIWLQIPFVFSYFHSSHAYAVNGKH